MWGCTRSVVLWGVLLGAACSDDAHPVDLHGTVGTTGSGGTAMAQSGHDAAAAPAHSMHATDAGSGGAPASQPHTPSTGEPRDAGNAAREDAAVHVAVDANVLGAEVPSSSPSAEYSADRWDGDLSHITIYKRDPAQRICAVCALAFPAAGSQVPDLELPSGWGLVTVRAFQADGDTCDAPSTGATAVQSHDLQGRVAWAELDSAGQPCSLDIDMTAAFDPTGRIPAQIDLFAEKLAVPCNH